MKIKPAGKALAFRLETTKDLMYEIRYIILLELESSFPGN